MRCAHPKDELRRNKLAEFNFACHERLILYQRGRLLQWSAKVGWTNVQIKH
jgi:hypothetical protein